MLGDGAWYILKGMTRLNIHMEVIDKQKCCKCKNEKEPDKHKYCSKCREYFKEYHYKNRDKKNEQRKLNRLKNLEHDKAYRQEYQQNNRDKINEKKKEYNKDYKQLEVFCDYCHCKVKEYRWSRHLQTEKHKHHETVKNDEEEKINNMTNEEKDEYLKIKKLKQIWKNVWLRS